MNTSPMKKKRAPLAYYFLFLLPKNAFSRFCGMIAEAPLPAFLLSLMIHSFIRIFKIDMSEAEGTVASFPTFNAFFTRKLKQGARPIDPSPASLVSPVDGTIGQVGTIQGGKLIQAKGLDYSIQDLLDDSVRAEDYKNGTYITIYLAPYNYHRIHSPVTGTVSHCTYVPGKLWTVSPLGVNHVEDLFSKNERIISYLNTSGGECALVKVGATVVGKIKVCYHSIESNLFFAKRAHFPVEPAYQVKKGDEVGVFELGSTVICCFKPGQVNLKPLEVGQVVKLGQSLGEFTY